MREPMRATRWGIGVAALAAACALCEAAGPQQADAWTRVPPLPTAPYQTDGFTQRIETAIQSTEADAVRQQHINEALHAEIGKIDPMELANRQTQYMLDHPQEAQALMQRNAVLGQQTSDTVVTVANELAALDAEMSDIDARYKAALDRQLAPVRAKFAELDKRAMKDPERTEAGDFYKPWAVAEWNGIAKEENAAYESFCTEWWGTSGPYHGWVKRVKAAYEKQIPVLEEGELVGAGFMVQMLGNSTESFKPVSKTRTVKEYMQKVEKVFAKRRDGPLTQDEGLKFGRPNY